MQTEENMAAKWHTVEAATIVEDKKKSEQEVTEEAVAQAYQAWQRKNESKPDAVFMRVPFAEKWNGLPVIADAQISASIVYVGVTR